MRKITYAGEQLSLRKFSDAIRMKAENGKELGKFLCDVIFFFLYLKCFEVIRILLNAKNGNF